MRSWKTSVSMRQIPVNTRVGEGIRKSQGIGTIGVGAGKGGMSIAGHITAGGGEEAEVRVETAVGRGRHTTDQVGIGKTEILVMNLVMHINMSLT